jgi:hypothetical protein
MKRGIKQAKVANTARALLILLPLLLALAGCDFMSFPEHEQNIPPGMGALYLKVNSARTIQPDNLGMGAFASFELKFMGTAEVIEYRIPSTLSDAVLLPQGTYTLNVTAYLDTGRNQPAAHGSASNITITASEGTSIDVKLYPFTDGEGQGTYRWNINLSGTASLTGATMTITPLNTVKGSTTDPVNLLTSTETYRSLNSGYYRVTVTLTKANNQPIVYREALHIYQYMESVFNKAFADGDFNNTLYTVTFDYDDGVNAPNEQSSWGNPVADRTPTRTFTAVAGLYEGTSPPANYHFDGWYYGDTLWDFDNPVLGDMTLKAKWSVPELVTEVAANNVAQAVSYVKAHPATYILYIEGEVSAAPQVLNVSGVSLSIAGIGSGAKINLSESGSLFTTGGGAATGVALVINNITLTGRANNDSPLVSVLSGSSFMIGSGSAVTGNGNTSWAGGGVSVEGGGALMIMNGTISGNTAVLGGGVYIDDGTFTMYSGSITGNSSDDWGSGVCFENGTFTMSGGSVSGNTGDYGDVFIMAVTGGNNVSVSGSAAISSLTLEHSLNLNVNSSISIASGWSGSIGSLNLHSTSGDLTEVAGNWTGKTVLNGDGITAALSRITLGNFVTSGGTRAIADTHEIDDSGKLVASFDFYAEVAKYAAATEDMTIVVPGNLTLNSNVTIPAPLTAGVTLTIKGNTTVTETAGVYSGITLTRGSQDSTAANGLFIVGANARLIFEDIIIDGGNITGNTASLVRVNGFGVFTMNEGAVLRNNRAADGGGVYLNGGNGTGNFGSFTMNGGEISGNTASANGGGIYIPSNASTGSFTMNGGGIKNNTANNGGGVYSSGTFNMFGGEISSNTASSNGGGVYATYNNFKVGGSAKIRNNIGNNLYITSIITLGDGSAGQLAPAAGMEIWVLTSKVSGIIVDSGATVGITPYFHADETGKSAYLLGDKIVIRESAFTSGQIDFYAQVANYANAASDMTITVSQDLTLPVKVDVPANSAGHTLTIRGSTPAITLSTGQLDSSDFNLFKVPSNAKVVFEDIIVDGAGYSGWASLVFINGGVFTMNDGAVLRNNHKSGSSSSGGGVSLGSGGTFNMYGGEISGNSANQGGGVHVDSSGTFNMYGGEIKNNTADGIYSYWQGGGVSMNLGARLNFGGSAKIRNNTKESASNNVYLEANQYITLGTDPAPSTGMEVWVTTATASGVIVFSGASAGVVKYFKADQAGDQVGKGVLLDGSALKIADAFEQDGSGFTISFDIVHIYPELSIDAAISLSGSNGNTSTALSLDSPEQYTMITWYVDGNSELSGPGNTTGTFNLDTADYNEVGWHTITVFVVKDGAPYNTTVWFEVVP